MLCRLFCCISIKMFRHLDVVTLTKKRVILNRRKTPTSHCKRELVIVGLLQSHKRDSVWKDWLLSENCTLHIMPQTGLHNRLKHHKPLLLPMQESCQTLLSESRDESHKIYSWVLKTLNPRAFVLSTQYGKKKKFTEMEDGIMACNLIFAMTRIYTVEKRHAWVMSIIIWIWNLHLSGDMILVETPSCINSR